MSIDDERRKDALIERLQLRFESVRERANNALADIQKLKEIRARRWVCRRCNEPMFFTKPMAKVACDQCPKCHGKDFAPG
jgi:Zn finger protein HypA/HybF involved in hydrogenase expression